MGLTFCPITSTFDLVALILSCISLLIGLGIFVTSFTWNPKKTLVVTIEWFEQIKACEDSKKIFKSVFHQKRVPVTPKNVQKYFESPLAKKLNFTPHQICSLNMCYEKCISLECNNCCLRNAMNVYDYNKIANLLKIAIKDPDFFTKRDDISELLRL
jgi:hypothetical protein